jgi:proteic killer suppression protein
MIAGFKSKALKRYWTKGDPSKIRPDWVETIRIILSRLEAAREPSEMNVPGLGFHPLKGDRKGEYAVSVSRNWRITFSWDDENAIDVNLEDYHGD